MTSPEHESDVRLAEPSDFVIAVPPGPPRAASTDASGSRSITPVPLAWRSWPVLDSPAEGIGLTGICLALVGVAFQYAGPLTAITAAVVLSLVTWRRYVPTFYELSALGVSENVLGRRRRIPWISIDRYVVGRRGAYLSSAGAPLELMRGLYLPWNDQREHILATLRYYLPRAEDVDAT